MEVLDVEARSAFRREKMGTLLSGYVDGAENPDARNGNVYKPHEDRNPMAKVGQEFFARRADGVAQELLGRTIAFKGEDGNIKRARLVEIAAYEGATKTTSAGALYLPGIVSISQKRGNLLIDISTGKGTKGEEDSSCITLRSGLVEMPNGSSELVVGPGNLSHKLGINGRTIAHYEAVNAYGRTIWITGEPVHRGQIVWKRGNSANCMGLYSFKLD